MHYIVLSRKYRPKNLNDLVGQDILSKALKTSLDTKQVPHAFLFHGIRGIGKTTTARILARCLSCVGNDNNTYITSNPCGICKSCISIDKDQHMDIMEFDAASKTGVDDIREIIDSSQYIPILGRYKIYIIDEVHMLSKNAFNALLKTLEEPPEHVKFIFATTEINKLPETILSRCMTFKLKPISFDELSNYIIEIAKKEGFSLEKSAADLISMESEGSVRDSLSILEQAIMLSSDTKNINLDIIVDMIGGVKNDDSDILLDLILNAKTKEALNKSEEITNNQTDPFILYKTLQSKLYNIISKKVNNQSSVKYSLSNLLYLWQIFLKQSENIKNAIYPENVLNAAIIIMSHTASFPNIEDLIINNNNNNDNNDQNIDKLKNDSNKLIDDVLKKFPGSIATEIE